MKHYIVFSLRLSKTLQAMGFTLVKVEPNRHRPNYNVYLFEDSAELREAISRALH